MAAGGGGLRALAARAMKTRRPARAYVAPRSMTKQRMMTATKKKKIARAAVCADVAPRATEKWTTTMRATRKEIVHAAAARVDVRVGVRGADGAAHARTTMVVTMTAPTATMTSRDR